MKMAELVKMIQERQGQMSIEEYANRMGIRGATLYRYYSEEREIGLAVLRKLIRFYKDQGDTNMVEALTEYAVEDGASSLPN